MFTRQSIISVAHSASHARRGAITLWMILIIPAIVLLFGVVVDMSRLWVARIELTNALEAAALSGVKTWEELGDRQAARDHAVAVFEANTVTGVDDPDLNQNGDTGNGNGNTDNTDGEVILGRVNTSGTPIVFESDQPPETGYYFAVRTQKRTLPISSIWMTTSWMFGPNFNSYEITASAVAIYDNSNNRPRIVHIDEIIDP